MGRNNLFLILGVLLVLLSLFSGLSFAETTCNIENCGMEITVKIAFAFDPGVQNQQQYIQNAKNEIESVWNGPNGYRTCGDCKCKVAYKAAVMSTASCSPPPAGYHCIRVTVYNNDPPRNQTNWTGAQFYIGYMYPPGVATGNGGNSITGWWSDIMSRPTGSNGNYKDFAHEAGHMMGLEDGDGGIMTNTSGPNSDPTQANIDETVQEICGANACPARCCCGNGQIDGNVGEQCDPFAGGCGADEYCCPYCCHCYPKMCIAAWGEYENAADCNSNCQGMYAKCYYNYQTGCWDCLKQEPATTPNPYDSTQTKQLPEGNHTKQRMLADIRDFYGALGDVGMLKTLFGDDRINLYIKGIDTPFHAVTKNGALEEAKVGALEDPTINMYTDVETLGSIADGETTVSRALMDGKIKYEGVGFLNGLRLGIMDFFFRMFSVGEVKIDRPAEEGTPREAPAGAKEAENGYTPNTPRHTEIFERVLVHTEPE